MSGCWVPGRDEVSGESRLEAARPEANWFLRYSKLYRILPYHTGSPMSCRFNTVSVWWSDTHVHRDHVFSSWAAGGSVGACRTPVDYNG
jgi:hypothetical protein